MRLLELFKGTGSVGRVFREMYPEAGVISLDYDSSCDATFCCDILEFDYRQYPTGYFDIIWASPDCRIFSHLQGTHVKGNKHKHKAHIWDSREQLQDARLANSVYVERVLEIIEYFQPVWWFIENPWLSTMKDLQCMSGLPFYRFDYCRFGFDYQKPTRIWTNREGLTDMKCVCNGPHAVRIGYVNGRGVDKKTKHRIPNGLLKILLESPLLSPANGASNRALDVTTQTG